MSLLWFGTWSKGGWEKGSPRPETGLASLPWCTPHHHPWWPRPSLEPSQQSTVPVLSAQLARPMNGGKNGWWGTWVHLCGNIFSNKALRSFLLPFAPITWGITVLLAFTLCYSDFKVRNVLRGVPCQSCLSPTLYGTQSGWGWDASVES